MTPILLCAVEVLNQLIPGMHVAVSTKQQHRNRHMCLYSCTSFTECNSSLPA
jgi:hypothetical protein